jgi:hypothetical protein
MTRLDRSLRLHCRYRVNAEFGVEDIETLLSSRFIDEDFFRPTIARYQSRDDAEVLRVRTISRVTVARSTDL